MSKQLHKQYLALTERIVALSEAESEFFWKAHPWMENKYYPKPWTPIENPEWDAERKTLRRRTELVYAELERVYLELYPMGEYPEMHGIPQQASLLPDDEAKALGVPVPKPEIIDAEEVDEALLEAEKIFGAKAVEMTEQDKRVHAKAQNANAAVWMRDGENIKVLVEKPLPSTGNAILDEFNRRMRA